MRAIKLMVNWLFILLVLIPFGGLIILVKSLYENFFARITYPSEEKIFCGHEWFWKEL